MATSHTEMLRKTQVRKADDALPLATRPLS